MEEEQQEENPLLDHLQDEIEKEEQYGNEALSGLSGAYPENQTVHTFLNNVATADDTTKTGYLGEEELGHSEFTLRSCKELALISNGIMNNQYFAQYFANEAEILTSTSLSRSAKLLELAIRQKKEIADVTKPRALNKGMFKSKNQPQPLE